MKRILSILLCLVVCMAMMPVGEVFAAGTGSTENYNWKVAGTPVTSDNAGDITGDGITVKEGGKVSYDATSNTLTLKDATIKPTSGAGIVCDGNTPVIELQGENVIDASGDGISLHDNSVNQLTIKSVDSKGKLTVTGYAGIDCSISQNATLTLSNVEVAATGTTEYGIYAKGDISLNTSTSSSVKVR